MMNRKERTMEVYMTAGAGMRLLKHVGSAAAMEVSGVLSAKDSDRLMKALQTIEIICSRAEDNMFRDYPELSNEYLDVFFGDVNSVPRNDVDRAVMEKARIAADGLFEKI